MTPPTQPTGDAQSPIALDESVPAELPPIELRYVAGPCTLDHNGYSVHVRTSERCVLQLGAEELELKQFHFHTPSEHTLAGEQFPLVLHLVHAATDGGLTVLCVFGRAGAANAGLEMLRDAIPAGADAADTQATVDPALLVGSVDEYLTYDGSLTTPPYSEGVRWLVLTEPITVSEAQVAAFADTTPFNARDLQARGDRVVRRRCC